MKRLERLGSIAFLTIMISFVFHLIGMSFNNWIENNCRNCDNDNPLQTWRTSLRNRCYQTSVRTLFLRNQSLISSKYLGTFVAEICLPNQFLIAKNRDSAEYCLLTAGNQSHTVCSFRNYDDKRCYCDYRSRTKLALSMTVLTSLFLASLIVVSHIISFTKLNYILRWLFPVSFILLILTITCIIVTLVTFSVTKYDDINESIYLKSLLQQTYVQEEDIPENWKQYLQRVRQYQYSTKIGWCFGMEILSLQFALVTLILYMLMFIAKNRPEPDE